MNELELELTEPNAADKTLNEVDMDDTESVTSELNSILSTEDQGPQSRPSSSLSYTMGSREVKNTFNISFKLT